MKLDDAVEAAAGIARQVVRANAAEVDRAGAWPREGIRALQAADLGGLVVPVEAGGQGLGLLAVARVCETLGSECASTAISFGMHLVGSAVMAARPTRDQTERYLGPIARGEHLTTLALSEPGTGSHFYLPESRLTPGEGGGFLLTGVKSFVTNGGEADSYVMSVAGSDADAAPGELSCVVVAAEAPGLAWSGPWRGWGMRGNSAISVELQGVRIPAEDLLGEPGDEIWYVFHVIAPYFLMAMAGTYLGIADAAFDEARRHLTDRMHSHTGVSLAHNTIIQHDLGELWSMIERTRSLIYDAARIGDTGDRAALPILCSAKAEVAETAERVTAEVMTLLGGRGYSEGHPVQRLYRDARAAHVMAPTTAMLRTWTGRAVLGLPLLGD